MVWDRKLGKGKEVDISGLYPLKYGIIYKGFEITSEMKGEKKSKGEKNREKGLKRTVGVTHRI